MRDDGPLFPIRRPRSICRQSAITGSSF